MKHINIEDFSNSELSAQINRELEAVARNVSDPNTEAKTARKVTVTITLKPNDTRDFITTSITTKSTLAPTLGAVTAMCVGKDLKTGKVEMAEMRSPNDVPGQLEMEEAMENMKQPEQGTAEIDGQQVDTETGEIVAGQDNNKITDLRARRA